MCVCVCVCVCRVIFTSVLETTVIFPIVMTPMDCRILSACLSSEQILRAS